MVALKRGRTFLAKAWSAIVYALAITGVLKLLLKSKSETLHKEQIKYCDDDSSKFESPYLIADFEDDFDKFLHDFKVHVYDTKPNLSKIFENIRRIEAYQNGIPEHWIVKRREFPKVNPDGQYALDVWLKTWIVKSRFNEVLPHNATVFFIDFKCTSLKNSQRKRFSGQRFTQQYVKQLILEISDKNRESTHRLNFLDHFYACAHDMGVESTRSAPESFRSNAIGIVHTADFQGGDAKLNFWNNYEDIKPSWQSGLVFNGHRDITAPPFMSSGSILVQKSYHQCKYLTMFVGSVNGRSVRQKVFSQLHNQTDILLGKAYGETYVKAFHQSKFCLVIRGLVTSTLRVSEAIHYGCIPVIISDGYLPPFSNIINWGKFSIMISEGRIHQIPDILRGIDENTWNAMNQNLLKVRHHFIYNKIPVLGDAFHMILYEVWLKTRKLAFLKKLT